MRKSALSAAKRGRGRGPTRQRGEGEVIAPQSRSSPFMPAFLRAFLASSVRALPAW
jgi:hypothetical protein